MIDRIARWKWVWFFVIALAAAAFWADRRWNRREHRHDAIILSAAAKYGIDPVLVKAVIWQESRFDEQARGRKGELGLMQISAIAALEWADAERIQNFEHEQLLDPVMNTQAGAWYLARALKRYTQTDRPIAYALADYNAGRSQVLRWLDGPGKTNSQVFLQQMDYPSTRHYVESILKRYRRYQHEFKAPAS